MDSVRAMICIKPTPHPSASPITSASAVTPERWSIHAQTTNLQQYHGAFPAAYSGTQSLSALPDTAKTFGATLYLGMRLWRGTELYVNPEFDQGFGLGSPGTPYNGTYGVAGFTSGEAYKLGRAGSYGRIQRAFIRRIYNFGGALQTIDPDSNQLADFQDTKHLTLTAGKFAVTDLFDTNAYAHDPGNDFLNWSIIDMGAFDYAADAWGYTYGVSAEAVGAKSTLRAGLFQMSLVPNQIAIEPQPFRQYSPIVEFEQQTTFLGGRPGTFKALVYGDDAYVGSYTDALAAAAGTGNPPNTAAVRNDKHWKIGAGLNIAQAIAPHIGVFTRLSAMNGTYEAYDFTDIDRSFSGGLSIDGGIFHRPNDAFGLARAFNGLSTPAQRYFAAGGMGILIGDGALSYGGENILETYYKVGVNRTFGFTFDYQRVVNPAYNTARGPVSVYSLRFHADK
jgi:high affinity Mn2+ porin